MSQHLKYFNTHVVDSQATPKIVVDSEETPLVDREFTGNVYLHSRVLKNVRIRGSAWIVGKPGYQMDGLYITGDLTWLVDPGCKAIHTKCVIGGNVICSGINSVFSDCKLGGILIADACDVVTNTTGVTPISRNGGSVKIAPTASPLAHAALPLSSSEPPASSPPT